MKKLSLFCIFAFSCIINAKNNEQWSISDLIAPHRETIDFVTSLDLTQFVKDQDVFRFFNSNGLYQKKDIKNFKRSLQDAQRLISKQNGLKTEKNNLQVLQEFVENHASRYYVLLKYYEIANFYHAIDESNQEIINLTLSQLEISGLSMMPNNNLYKFIKKISLDLRRLKSLSIKQVVSDELVIKIHWLIAKLNSLTDRIINTEEYKYQLSSARWFKALIILALPIAWIAFTVLIVACVASAAGGSSAMAIGMAGAFSLGVGSVIALCAIPLTVVAAVGVTTTCDISDSIRYEIPMEPTSCFSLARF